MNEGETLHLVHEDGTVTVVIASQEDNTDPGGSHTTHQYITDPNTQQKYILQSHPTDSFLTLVPVDDHIFQQDVSHSPSPLEISKIHSGENEELIDTEDNESLETKVLEAHSLDNVDLKDDNLVDNDNENLQNLKFESENNILNTEYHDSDKVLPPKKLEQDSKYCANCYSKLVFQRGKSKKLSDSLYGLSQSTIDSLEFKKSTYSEVTVLEAIELLFGVSAKKESCSIPFSSNYVFCFKCIGLISKLHCLYMKFYRISTFPSFMRALFEESGLIKDRKEILEHETSLQNETIIQSPNKIIDKKSLYKNNQNKNSSEDEDLDNKVDEKYVKEFNLVPCSVITEKIETITSKSKPQFLVKKSLKRKNQVLESFTTSESSKEERKSRLPRKCNKAFDYLAFSKGEKIKVEFPELKNETDESSFKNNRDEGDMAAEDEENLEKSEDQDFMSSFRKFKMLKRRRLQNKISSYLLDKNSHKRRGRGRPRRSDSLKILQSDSLVNFSESSHNEPIKEEVSDPDYSAPKSSTKTKKDWTKCKKCCASFRKSSHFYEHLKIHEFSSDESERFTCSVCKGDFNTANNLKRHTNLYHSINRSTKTEPLDTLFKCTECGMEFGRKTHYKAHLFNQHGIERFLNEIPCPVCARSFLSEASLEQHLQKRHVPNILLKKYECEECSRTFLKKCDLVNHLTTHSNIRKYMCEICGFSSKRPQDLTRHRKLVHLKEVRHICEVCSKGFLSNWQLKSHMYTHNSYKGFHCKEAGCGKSFRCQNNLRQHILVHKGVKYPCQYCGEKYSRPAYLSRHVKINHLGISLPPHNKKAARAKRCKEYMKNYQVLEGVSYHIIEQPENDDEEGMELELDLPSENGERPQVILHGFGDDDGDGLIMEYIIG